jgi:hypothetical protein
MNQTLASPSPATSLRYFWQRVWNDPETRPTVIGILGMVLIHLLLWLVAPYLLRIEPVAVRPHSTAREFNIELAPEMFAKPQPKPPEPFKFVETNPDAPENTPDKTNNFAAQNQQVAQEKPTPDGKSDRPAMEGKKDFESSQIVSGRLSQPVEPVEAASPPSQVPVAEQTVTPPRKEQIPLPGAEKFEGESKEGVGGNLAKRLENATAVPEKIEGMKDATQTEGIASAQPAIDPRRPRPRPQITKQPQVRPAILSENKFGTTNIGNIAVDAKWSNYGAYLQRMIDTVQIQWERIIIEQKANPVIGSTVTVKFIMNDEGRITQIINVDTTANETASRACVSAITDRAPYGPWTEDMKAVLGDKQEMTFTFYYQ